MMRRLALFVAVLLALALSLTAGLLLLRSEGSTRPDIALDEAAVLDAVRKIVEGGPARQEWAYLAAAFRQASPSFRNLHIRKEAVIALKSRRWQCFYTWDVSIAYGCQTPQILDAFNRLCSPEFFGSSETTPSSLPAVADEPACEAPAVAQVEQLMKGLPLPVTRSQPPSGEAGGGPAGAIPLNAKHESLNRPATGFLAVFPALRAIGIAIGSVGGSVWESMWESPKPPFDIEDAQAWAARVRKGEPGTENVLFLRFFKADLTQRRVLAQQDIVLHTPSALLREQFFADASHLYRCKAAATQQAIERLGYAGHSIGFQESTPPCSPETENKVAGLIAPVVAQALSERETTDR